MSFHSGIFSEYQNHTVRVVKALINFDIFVLLLDYMCNPSCSIACQCYLCCPSQGQKASFVFKDTVIQLILQI